MATKWSTDKVAQIKAQYLLDEEENVLSFFRKKGLVSIDTKQFNGRLAELTKGWREEKREKLRKIHESVENEILGTYRQNLKKVVTNLENAELRFMTMIAQAFQLGYIEVPEDVKDPLTGKITTKSRKVSILSGDLKVKDLIELHKTGRVFRGKPVDVTAEIQNREVHDDTILSTLFNDLEDLQGLDSTEDKPTGEAREERAEDTDGGGSEGDKEDTGTA